MDKDSILAKVMDLVAETLETDAGSVTAESRIREDLGADSMHVVTLIIALDEAFDAEFNLEDVPKDGVTVAWIADYVARTLARTG
jgi:acyl carrier protein